MEILLSIVMKIISIVMLVVFILSIVLLILTFRKPRKVSILSIAITIVISLVTLVIFSALIHYEPSFWLWLLMAIIGITIGIFWARTTRVFVQNSQVMSQNSILYLGAWGGIFTLNQLITIVTNRPPDIAMALLIISTATVWGTNATIIRRYFKIRTLQPQTATMAAQSIAQTPVALPKTPGAAEETLISRQQPYCQKCRVLSPEDASFCMKCGGKL